MSVSNNKKLLLAAGMGIILSFGSCKKYEDGPGLSFRTKTTRLVGNWELIEVDGQQISRFGEFTLIDFDKDGDFTMAGSYYDYNGQYVSFREIGDWEWENGKEEIEVQGSTFKEDWEILRLTYRELWFEVENGLIWKCEKD
tara:strand:+ start:413 stop:835 length:423 start_codon:yes stop_codon:yes gene_type:complete